VTGAEIVTRYACSTCVEQMITYRHLSCLEVIGLSERSFNTNTSLIIKAVGISILKLCKLNPTQVEKLEAQQLGPNFDRLIHQTHSAVPYAKYVISTSSIVLWKSMFAQCFATSQDDDNSSSFVWSITFLWAGDLTLCALGSMARSLGFYKPLQPKTHKPSRTCGACRPEAVKALKR